jgi:hypothetical protein
MPGRYHPFRHIAALAYCAEPRTTREVTDAICRIEQRSDVRVTTTQMLLRKQVRDGLLTMTEGQWPEPRPGRPPAYWELTEAGRDELARLVGFLTRAGS